MALTIPDSGYKRSVGLGAGGDARLQTGLAGSPEAYGAQVGQAMDGFSGAVTKAAAVMDKVQEDRIASDVLAAQTEYQKRLSDALYTGDNALLARKGENAYKIDSEYRDVEKKIREETMAKLPNFELAQKAFARVANQEAQSGIEMVNRYRQQEVQRTFKLNLTNAFTTNADTTALNYNNPVAIQQGLAKNSTFAQAWAVRFGPAEADAVKREHDQSLINKAIENAWGKNDFAAMETLLDTHGDKLGVDQASKWQHAITERNKANTRAQTVMDYIKDPSVYTGDFLDPEKAIAKAQAKTRTISIGGKVAPGFDGGFEAFKASTVNLESGDNYDARGPVMSDGDQALGRYQIMRSNWSSWAQEAGLGADAPLTPANQDAVYKYKVKQLYDQFGGDWGKVAVAWQAGPARAEWSDERLSTISDGNMTPVEYRQRVLSAMGAGGTTETKEVPMFDATELAALKQEFQGVQNDQIREKNRREQETRKNVLNWMAVNDDLPTNTKLEYLRNSGLEPAEIKVMSDNLLKQDYELEKKKRAAESTEAVGALSVAKAQGILTVQDVNGYQDKLSREDYWKWLAIANGTDHTEQERGDDLADKDWHSRILNDPLYGTTARKNKLIGGIQARLNVENAHGTERSDRAKQLLAEATNDEKIEWLSGYGKRNDEGFRELDTIYPGISALFKAGYNSDKGIIRIDGYEMKSIANAWADRASWDPYAKQAWDYLVGGRQPINENIILRVRNRFAKEAGAEEVDSLY